MLPPSASVLRSALWDRVGIGLSVLCLLHCLALPFVVTSASVLAAEAVHLGVALVAAPVALLALVPGYRAHGRRSVLVLGALGMVLLIGAVPLVPLVGDVGERGLTVGGALVLTATHLWNAHIRGLGHSHA